jgi:hypothetical protein
MPQINSIPEVTYQPDQPYHYLYDNLPLKNILTRIGLVNIQVDTNTDILRGAGGSAGSLSNRLGTSLEDSGALKAAAVDESLHNIGHHSDGMGPDGVEYVRMTSDERNKLLGVSSGANSLQIEIEDTLPTIGSFVNIENGILKIRNSPTIFFDFEAPDILKAHSIFPPDAAHRHHYDLVPAYDIPSNPSFQNFKTTSFNTPFEEGSLRVYVNGIRLAKPSEGALNYSVDVPDYGDPNGPWIPTHIESQDHSAGTFSLNRALTIDDVIRIDFDETFINPSISGSVVADYTVQPASLSIYDGEDANFSFTLELTNSLYNLPQVVYQYSTNLIDWANINEGTSGFSSTTPGVINGYLNLTNVSVAVPFRQYRVICSDPREGYSVISEVFTLTVNPQSQIE